MDFLNMKRRREKKNEAGPPRVHPGDAALSGDGSAREGQDHRRRAGGRADRYALAEELRKGLPEDAAGL